jgi:hypothetical protein
VLRHPEGSCFPERLKDAFARDDASHWFGRPTSGVARSAMTPEDQNPYNPAGAKARIFIGRFTRR